ncbi:MAG: hypothetical protein ACE5H3_12030 [Planctomycetota bacterium]
MTLRIAQWCTPRTVSTATLRSFVQRPDTEGVDEPFYAWYLRKTGKQHPMREEVLASQPADWVEVVEKVLLGPCGRPVQFVKHMAHHLVGGIDLSFAQGMVNTFLIREPRSMLPSLKKRIGEVRREDTGFSRMAELLRRFCGQGKPAIVVDSSDLLRDPPGILAAYCRAVGLEFDPAMLSWPPGRHPCYGVWAPAWYGKVENSRGFQAPESKEEPFPADLEPLLDWAQPLYDELHRHRLRASGKEQVS